MTMNSDQIEEMMKIAKEQMLVQRNIRVEILVNEAELAELSAFLTKLRSAVKE